MCDGVCYSIGGTNYEASHDKLNFLFFNWDRVKLAMVVVSLPIRLPVFGYNLGWLGWYFLVSIPLVILIRKLMKIYV